MPFLGIGLHLLLAVICAIHALRSGRELYWLFILFAFPLLGSIVYSAVFLLPDIFGSRGVRKAQRAVTGAVANAINPGRELRDAQAAFEHSPSIDNRVRFARALAGAGEYPRAITEFRACLTGLHVNEPSLRADLARALADSGDPVAAAAEFEKLFADVPRAQTVDLQVLYAGVLARCPYSPDLRARFAKLVEGLENAEAKCLYADWLARGGENGPARQIFQEIVNASAHWPAHARKQNREWLNRAKRGIAS